MYAIVKSGGKQYRVERGQRLLVERLTAEEGASVALEPVLFRSDEVVFDKAGLEKVNVTARVIAHERGAKLRVFKFKPKRGYKRRTGHRQSLTRIEVTELELGGRARTKARGAKTDSAKADATRAGSVTAEGHKAQTATGGGAKRTVKESGAKGKASSAKGKADAKASSAAAAPKRPAGKARASAAKAKAPAKRRESGTGTSKPRAPKAKPGADASKKPTRGRKADEEG
ncbi:MAG TPA: 50S ribosomal protein L21 [Solirubrobacteraceae bacterium]|nr:50S ribosomal protein L21 [Solirubrobacteraceae bacterium]